MLSLLSRYILLLLFLPAALSVAQAAGLPATQQNTADAKRTLIVGGDFSYPPYEYIDKNGNAAGFNIDLMRAIAAEENLNIEFRLGAWKGQRRLLEAGKIDILPMFISARRDESVDFSKPFVFVNHALFVRRDDKLLPQSLEELKGLDVLVETESYAYDMLSHMTDDLSLITVESEHAAIQLLALGRYDVAVLGGLRGRLLLAQSEFSNITTSGPPLLPAQYALAVPAGNDALLRKLNQGLQQVKASGEFDRLYNKWIAQSLGVLKWQRLIHIGMWAGLTLLALIIVASLWIFTLKREVGRQTRALKSSEAQFRATFENAGAGIVCISPNLRLHQANDAFAAMLGTNLDNLKGRSLRSIFDRGEIRHLLYQGRRLLTESANSFSAEFGFTDFEGRAGWANVVVTVLHDADKTVRGFIGVVEDRTETQQLARQLHYQSNHDALTGLNNRQALNQRLNDLMGLGTENLCHALCLLDIDHFSMVNDIHGHDTADEMLRQFASELNNTFGQEGSLARLGGDEFGLLIEDCTLEAALELANDLQQLVSAFHFSSQGKQVKFTASIGIVPFNRESELPGGVLGAANIACTAAKDKGGNHIHVFVLEDQEVARHHRELKWVSLLSAGMEENHFELYYQPIVSLRDNTSGPHYELLIRYRDKHNKLIYPAQFIPAAEHFLMMEEMDRWVVTHALEWLQSNPEHTRQLAMCAINLSGQSVGNPAFHLFFEQALDDYNVPAEKLCIEITETAAIANISVAAGFARRLKHRGCRLALDDFGIGMSSFEYLRLFPVDFLKIDGSFVQDIENNLLNRAVVSAIVGIGRALGMKTIAEFVETPEVLRRIDEIGVDYAQGFYFARPQPLANSLDRQLEEELLQS